MWELHLCTLFIIISLSSSSFASSTSPRGCDFGINITVLLLVLIQRGQQDGIMCEHAMGRVLIKRSGPDFSFPTFLLYLIDFVKIVLIPMIK